ncbi:MAG: acetyltransferase [Runella sp.]
MLLYGASGHAKVIISCLNASGIAVSQIFDDDLTKKDLWGIPVVGVYTPNIAIDEPLIISIGNNAIREKVAASIRHWFGVALHPKALIDDSVKIGEGSVILHGAVVQADTQIGKHVIINTLSSVDHDCVIEDFVHIAPRATLCGSISVGKGTLIGAGAVITPNLRIGKGCLIAAGSVVTKNIPDYAVVRGNPAKVLKIITP